MKTFVPALYKEKDPMGPNPDAVYSGYMKNTNTKVLLGVVAAIVILVAGFFLLRPTQVSAPVETSEQAAASTTPTVSQPKQTAGATTQPTFTFGTSTAKITRAVTQFDPSSLISTSTYPSITGTANVPLIGIIIRNSKGVGIVGTSDIPVVQGHWSYPCSVALQPGTYTLILYANKTITAGAQLIVTKS
jgi:hypothetical protein